MNFLQTIVIACLCVVPRDAVLRESAAAVERNFFYDEGGRLVFEQVIFFNLVDGKEEVIAWRLVKDNTLVPKRDWSASGYVATWSDADQVRQVRTNSVRETHLQYDPELIARESLPADKRRGLLRGGEGKVR